MTARYWVLIADELLAAGPRWPDGMRVSPVPASGAAASVTEPPGASWYLIEDDNASEALSGCKVELVLNRDAAGRVTVADRKVLP